MTAKKLVDMDVSTFRHNLLDWYAEHKRDMPWRRSKDPYAILVSEIMLQQTQVRTVIPYFERFLTQFPNPAALAEAEESAVLKLWEGLGYYRRARFLHEAAKQIQLRFGGKFPKKKADIDQLKGVGSYTSAAVASIAFDLPHACVDGNVIRVISRLAALDADVSQAATRKALDLLAQFLLDESRPGDHNQAMMELGATVCTPRNPTCMTCPVQKSCQTQARGENPHLRPVKSAKVKVGSQEMVMGCLTFQGQFLLALRPAKGLMADMWEFPALETSQFDSWEHLFGVPCTLVWQRPKPFVKKFTHLHVTYHVGVWELASLPNKAPTSMKYQDTELFYFKDIASKPLTRVCQKLLKELKPFWESETSWNHNQSPLPGMSPMP